MDVDALLPLAIPAAALLLFALAMAIVARGLSRRAAPLASALGGKVGLLGDVAFARRGLSFVLGAVDGAGPGVTTILTALVDVDGPWFVGVVGAEAYARFGAIPGVLHPVVVADRQLVVAAPTPTAVERLTHALARLEPRQLDVLLPQRFGSLTSARVRHLSGARDELRCFVLGERPWDEPVVVAHADALWALVQALQSTAHLSARRPQTV